MTRKIEEIVTLGYEEKNKREEEREEEEKKRREKKKEEVEIEELTEEEHGDGKLTSNKASEWEKLGGNWNNRNEEKREEKEEEENWRIGKEIPGLEMEEKREEVWKAATREKEGMSRNIEEIITMV